MPVTWQQFYQVLILKLSKLSLLPISEFVLDEKFQRAQCFGCAVLKFYLPQIYSQIKLCMQNIWTFFISYYLITTVINGISDQNTIIKIFYLHKSAPNKTVKLRIWDIVNPNLKSEPEVNKQSTILTRFVFKIHKESYSS